jgi:hypothetical protein
MMCVHVTAAKHDDVPPIMVNACSGKVCKALGLIQHNFDAKYDHRTLT